MDFYRQRGLPSPQPLVPPNSLDDILADLRANPSLDFDLNGLPPVLASEADVGLGQDVFDLTHSLPPDLGRHQSLSHPSRSAPPIVSLPDGLPSSDSFFAYAAAPQNGAQNGYQRKLSLGNIAHDLQGTPLTTPGARRSSGSRGSSEDDPPFVASGESAGIAKRQRRMAEKNRTAQKRYRERQKDKMHDFERQVEELSSRVSMLMREKANLESRNSLLERVVQLKDTPESAPPQGSLHMSAEELALCSAIAELRNSISSSEQPWCAGDVRGINDKLLMQLFDTYPKELMQCMLEMSSQTADDPYYQRIVHLVKALGNMVLQLTLQDPQRVAELTAELKKNTPVNAGELWAKCLEAMQLSKSQKQRILELRSKLFELLTCLLEKRRVILQHLEESMPKDPSRVSLGPAHKETFHKALEASEELRESLMQEHKYVGGFIAAWYAGDVLTPMQRARSSIEGYPYHIDVFSLVDIMAMQEGEESHDSFIASLTSHNDSRSLMPAESAFRMVSSLPPQGTEGPSSNGPSSTDAS